MLGDTPTRNTSSPMTSKPFVFHFRRSRFFSRNASPSCFCTENKQSHPELRSRWAPSRHSDFNYDSRAGATPTPEML